MLRLRPLLVAALFCFAGCTNPRELPGFKGAVEKQEAITAQKTEEAIKESPLLQELDRLCREVLPLPEGFALAAKKLDFKNRNDLTYYYSSAAEYQMVSNFYQDYFTRNGWQLTARKDSGWGQKRLEFRKDGYAVVIYHGPMGGGVNYSIHCKKP